MKGDQLTNAAAVLFAKDAREGYPQCHIRMARFRGLTKQGSFIDSKSFYGNAFQILSEASDFIDRHLPVASNLPVANSFELSSFVRMDTPALPILAVREALINAIIHRDYSNRTSHIALAIYDDRLEIWSFGRLSPHLTIPELSQSHLSHPRNKNIAEMFHIRGFVECWGTGTKKIIDDCRDAGLPLPEFSEYSGGFSTTFRFKESISPSVIISKPTSEVRTPRQQEIIDILIAHGSLSTKNIQAGLKQSVSVRILKRELLNLTKNGILEERGKTKNRVWFLLNKLS